MFLGQLRQGLKGPGEEQEREEESKKGKKSESAEAFLKTPKTKAFVKKWASQKRAGEPLYTRRGINAVLRAVYGTRDTDEELLAFADELFSMLGGMDGLKGFLAGCKAKSEGILKGLKSIVGR